MRSIASCIIVCQCRRSCSSVTYRQQKKKNAVRHLSFSHNFTILSCFVHCSVSRSYLSLSPVVVLTLTLFLFLIPSVFLHLPFLAFLASNTKWSIGPIISPRCCFCCCCGWCCCCCYRCMCLRSRLLILFVCVFVC